MSLWQRHPYLRFGGATLALVAAAVMVGHVLIWSSQDLLRQTAGQALALASAETAAQLGTLLTERADDLEIMAGAFSRHLGRPATIKQYLDEIAAHHPVYLWIGVVDADGHLITESRQGATRQNQSDEPWFRQVQQTQHTIVQDVEPFRYLYGGPDTIALSAPILNADRQFLGAVTARIGLDVLEVVVTRTIRVMRDRHPLLGGIEYQFLKADGTVFIDSDLNHKGHIDLKKLGLPSALVKTNVAGFVEEAHMRRHVTVLSGYADTNSEGNHDTPSWRVLMRLDLATVLSHTNDYLLWFGGPFLLLMIALMVVLLWNALRLHAAWERSHQETTRARNAESALRESEGRTRAIIENALDAVIVMDQKGRVVDWNSHAEELLGWTRDEAITQHLLKLLTPATAPLTTAQDFTSFLRTQEWALNRRVEMRIQTRQGEDIAVEMSVSVFLQDGQRRFGAFIRDIRKEVTSRQALHQAKAIAETSATEKALILNAVDAFFIRIDRHATVCEWTPAAERVFHIPAADALGQSLHSLGPLWQIEPADGHSCFLTTGAFENCTHERVRLLGRRPEPGMIRLTMNRCLRRTLAV